VCPRAGSNFWSREISGIGYKKLGNLRRQNIRRTEEYVSSSSLLYIFNACSVCIPAYTESPCISLTPKILQIGHMPVYSKGALRRQDVSSKGHTALLCADSMVFVHNMNPQKESRSTAPLAFNLGTRRRRVTNSSSDRFSSGKKPCTH
jgi:hypothetical protein